MYRNIYVFLDEEEKKRLQNMRSVTNQFYSHFTHTNIETSADECYDLSNLMMINFPLGKHPPTTNF